MDDARKLLDSLMGPSRDASLKEQRRSDGWKDCNVCKRFLVGFCPNDSRDNWFKNTRRDTGSCTKIHSESLKQKFLEHPERHKYEPEYEKEFLSFLESLLFEADAWIARERKNCKPAGKETRIPPHIQVRMETMQVQSEEQMKKAEELAESGNLVGSKEAVLTATKLKEDIEGLKEKYTFVSGGEEVCEVCGVRCQPGEIADYKAHLDGKLHEGYSRIREKVKELRGKARTRGSADEQQERSNDTGERERGRDRGGAAADRGRGEQRPRRGAERCEKERDRGSDKDKDRGRRRGEARGGDKPRSRSRSHRRRGGGGGGEQRERERRRA